MFALLRRISAVLAAPSPEAGGPPAVLAVALQWVAAFCVAVPVLLATLGGFTERYSGLFRPAGLQLLIQLPGAFALAVAAHYLRVSCGYVGLGRWVRWFVAFSFVFFGSWILALGVDVILIAIR